MSETITHQDAGTECVIESVAFFYEEGKGGENYHNKNIFRCRVSRNEMRESIGKFVTFGKDSMTL